MFDRMARAAVAAACTYEAVAIVAAFLADDGDGPLPTITTITEKHPELGAITLGALARHFFANGRG